MIVGDRLRVIREEKKLSQGDIEKRTGLLRCYVSRVENGHTVPAIETLEKMARALEVPLYQLFYDGEEPPVLPNFPKRKSSDADAWGSFGKDAPGQPFANGDTFPAGSRACNFPRFWRDACHIPGKCVLHLAFCDASPSRKGKDTQMLCKGSSTTQPQLIGDIRTSRRPKSQKRVNGRLAERWLAICHPGLFKLLPKAAGQPGAGHAIVGDQRP